MARVTESTDGRVQFDHFPAEQLGTAEEMINITQSGVTDIGMVSPPYISDRLPLSGVGDLPAMHEDACDGGTEAIQRGPVDGTVLSPVSAQPYKVDELINYGTEGAQLGSFTFMYSISQTKWDILPSDIQDALLEAGRDTNQHLCAALNREEKATRLEMKQEGTKFYEIPPEEKQRWREAVRPVRDRWVEDMKKEGLPGEQAIQEMAEAVEAVSKK